MKKIMIFLGLVGFIGLSAAGDDRDPRDAQDPHGRQYVSHSVLSDEDRARLGEDFDAFLEGSGSVQGALPDGPMSLPGGGMFIPGVISTGQLPAGVHSIQQMPDQFSTPLVPAGSSAARALFDFMNQGDSESDASSLMSDSPDSDSSVDENDGRYTPADQIGRRGNNCPGSGVSERTPAPEDPRFAAFLRENPPVTATSELSEEGSEEDLRAGQRRTREQAGGRFPETSFARRQRRNFDA